MRGPWPTRVRAPYKKKERKKERNEKKIIFSDTMTSSPN
jgi:hypothetical protein